MLPKRTCPSCSKKTIKIISMLKNLFITNEGSKCSNCNSLILVKQSYKETLKYPFSLLLLLMFFAGSLVLLEPFGEFTKGSFIEGTLFEVFLNMIVLFTPMIILTLVYCYKIPIIEGTDEEITKRNKIGIVSRLIKASIFVIIVIWVYFGLR